MLGDLLEYKVHWKGYPSADDSWVPHEDLHLPNLLKEFYAQGGKVQAVKRRWEQLQKLISSLLCLPPSNSPVDSSQNLSPPLHYCKRPTVVLSPDKATLRQIQRMAVHTTNIIQAVSMFDPGNKANDSNKE
jgi:chromodomain-containing protein